MTAVQVADEAKKISETISPRRTGLRNFANGKTADKSDSRKKQDEKTAKLFDKMISEGNIRPQRLASRKCSCYSIILFHLIQSSLN